MAPREVERWDLPNKKAEIDPIPLWGATSIKVQGREAVGPILPVKRENDFAANELKADPLTRAKPAMGDKLVPYPCYPNQGAKHGFTGVGTPQSPCDVGGMPKTQYGPTYGFTEGKEKNSYVPKPPVGGKYNYPLVNGPVLIQQTGTGKYAPMPLPKVDALMMSGPVFPIPDHYSKYSTQIFGCSGSGLKREKTNQLYGPGNRDVGNRNSAMIEAGKYVPEVKAKAIGPVIMVGPVYAVPV